jgi:hypothetical protein
MAFYAVEYVYGSTVVNNGGRADRVLRFTRRHLRDAWVNDGPVQDGPGYRAMVGARNPLVRKADFLGDGDVEAWEILATQRVTSSPGLQEYRYELAFYDYASEEHWRKVATASERELIAFAKGLRQGFLEQ